MDFSYLIRSGLAIPDYWHPRLEIQKDFQTGRIGRYPVSLQTKADYPGSLNRDGVPVLFVNERSIISPATVILFGLGSHDAFIQTNDERYRAQMMQALSWLQDNHVDLGQGIGWPFPEDLVVYGLRAPWFSGMVQGLAISLLVRGSKFDPNGPWESMTRKSWEGYHLPVELGGFRRKLRQGIVYEEYPAHNLNFVFNGMCHALIGLWEAVNSGIVPQAQRDFDNGVQAVRSFLPCFCRGRWSLYSLSDCMGKPILASPYYHRANGLLAKVIGHMADDMQIRDCGNGWLSTSHSLVRRTIMSVRISVERFLNAPGLLSFDKSKKSLRSSASRA